mgnify:CR=1 FL=1
MTGDVLRSQVVATELQTGDDPYLWLEDISSERSLAWVREQNAATVRELGTSGDFEILRQRLLAIFDSKERIPGVAKHGAYYYNFWRDAAHVRGLWRRTTLEEYIEGRSGMGGRARPGQAGGAEDENWVWKGSDVLRPTYDRALIFLSRGGGDAVVVREFDLDAKEFVRHGFFYRKPRPARPGEIATRSTWEPTSVRGHSRTPDTRASSRSGSAIPYWRRRAPF